MAPHPCDTSTCSAEIRYLLSGGSRCPNVFVRFATPMANPQGRPSIQLAHCATNLPTGINTGVASYVRATATISWAYGPDAVGNLAGAPSVHIYKPPTTNANCITGANLIAEVPDTLDLDTGLIASEGGLAAMLLNSDDIEVVPVSFTACGSPIKGHSLKIKFSDCSANAISRISTTDTAGTTTSGFGLFFDEFDSCIKAELVVSQTGVGACATNPQKVVRLSFNLLNTGTTQYNALQCIDGKAAVIIREFGAGGRLSLQQRPGANGLEIVSDVIPSQNDNNFLSVSVDCGTTPGQQVVGVVHAGFNKLSKSFKWSRVADTCSVGRWFLDAELLLTNQHVNAISGVNTNGARLTATGYWFNPEVGGNVDNVEQPIGGLLYDGNDESITLELNVKNPSSVRSAIAVIDFRSAHTLRVMKSGQHYRIRSFGFIGASVNGPGNNIGQDTYRVDTRTGFTGGTWRDLVGSYSETVVVPMIPQQEFYCSLYMKLEKLVGGGAIASGDIEIGSFEITSAIVTVGVDGPIGYGQPSVGAIPRSVAALP